MAITIDGSGTVTGISAGGLPDGVITTDDIAAGAVTQAKRSEQLTLGTAQASTSGTSIDFTGIPSWVKRITVMFNGVSTSGTSSYQIQAGNGSFVTTGYVSSAIGGTTGNVMSGNFATSGFVINTNVLAASQHTGSFVISNITANTWIQSGNIILEGSGSGQLSSGRIALSGTLDRIRITTVNGTDTFDAGSINILYE
jgi:hypothetical protein